MGDFDRIQRPSDTVEMDQVSAAEIRTVVVVHNAPLLPPGLIPPTSGFRTQYLQSKCKQCPRWSDTQTKLYTRAPAIHLENVPCLPCVRYVIMCNLNPQIPPGSRKLVVLPHSSLVRSRKPTPTQIIGTEQLRGESGRITSSPM